MTANETTDFIMSKIIEDLPFKSGDEVSVLLNGLGSTSLLEEYIIFKRINEILIDMNIKIHKTWVGEYFTSMEMGGFSITLTKLDEETKKYIDYPVNAVHFIQK
jgi:dihydroxyacetone kinase-like protein